MADPRPAGRPDPRPPVQAVGGTRHPGRGPILSFTGEGQDQVPGAWAQRCGPGRLCETPVMAVDEAPRARSTRMTGRERREQLVSVGRQVFAEKGYDMASVEEIASRATVSKPIVYEHFGGKEGLYAVVVDREVSTLLSALETSLQDRRAHPRLLMERAAMAFLSYIDENEDGFRILVRDSPVSRSEEHTSELQSRGHLVCRLLLEKKKCGYSTICCKLWPTRRVP